MIRRDNTVMVADVAAKLIAVLDRRDAALSLGFEYERYRRQQQEAAEAFVVALQALTAGESSR